MPKFTHKNGKPWTTQDIEQIKHMVGEKTPTRLICLELGRTQAAVYRKASQVVRPPVRCCRNLAGSKVLRGLEASAQFMEAADPAN
jgi:hypothetical protein